MPISNPRRIGCGKPWRRARGAVETGGHAIEAGGLAAAIATYLSTADPAHGCSFAALLPELARQLASALPPQTANPEATEMSVSATLIGTLQLAGILEDTALSARNLAAGADAALRLAEPRQDGGTA
jgi:hypothetical protein